MNREYTANCAICNGPGDPECPCEGDRLNMAINQAEKRWIESWITKTREWVTNKAIETITTIFNKKKEMRNAQYHDYLQTLPYWPIYVQYRGRPPLHPHLVVQLQRQIAEADADLKRGIDADWKSCVVRYPDVLNHFYSQVKITMPKQAEPPFASAFAQPPPRAPSVNPQAQAAHGHAGQSILRSSTAPPKKQRERRSSKIEGKEFNDDIFAQLTAQLSSMKGPGGQSKAGRGTPAPPQSMAGLSHRPSNKRRESREYGVSGRPAPPPHVPQPPSYHGDGSTFGFR